MTSVRSAARRRQHLRRRRAAAVRARLYACGERAWQQYKRDGRARTDAVVIDALAARAEAARARFEPPRVELRLRPADLDDEPAPRGYADISPPRTNLARLRAQLGKKRRDEG